MVEAMLMTRRTNPTWPNPFRNPWSGTNRQGPDFKDFAMPKVAENTDEDKVTQNSIGLRSKIKRGCKIQRQKKICTDGIDSRNGSEIDNMIYASTKKAVWFTNENDVFL